MDKKQRTILLVCIAYGIWQTSSQWMNTLLSFLHWNTYPPMNVLQISYIQAVGSFCNALGAFLLGQIIDTSGSKSVFLAAIIMTALYYGSMSVSQSFITFMLSQIFRLGYHFEAGAEMYLATVTSERDRASAMLALNSLPQAAAFVLGPILASRCAAWFGLRTAATVCAGFLAAALCPLILWVLPDTHDVPKLASARLQPFDGGFPLLMKNSALREAISLRVLVVAPFICFELVGRQFIMRKYFNTPTDAAQLMLITGASMLLVQFIILPKLQRKATPKLVMQLGLTVLTLAYIAILYSRSFIQMLLVSGIQSAAYAVVYAETSVQMTSSVQLIELGKATGMAACFSWFTHCIMPLITGQLAMYYHYTYAIHLSTCISMGTLAYVTYACNYVDARVQDVLPVFGGLS